MSITMIESEEALRQLYGKPIELAKRKVLTALDDHCRTFIAVSPLLILASHDGNGQCDASPRGDRPGFVEIIDDRRLLLPDKPGNNRIDSLMNIFRSPSIGMLFLVPGVGETLRVNGHARITSDPELLTKHGERGQVPKTGLYIEIAAVFLHCSRSLLSAKIWTPSTWPDRKSIPMASRIWKDHMLLNQDAVESRK